MPLVARQSSVDIRKISDLKEAVGTHGDVSVWIINGEEFRYIKGESVIRSRATLSSDWISWDIEKANKTAAKKKIFELI